MTKGLKPDVQAANKLLGLLPKHEFNALRSAMDLVDLTAGQCLCERGRIDYAYFPISGVVTRFVRMTNHDRVEVGLIGNEGMLPVCLCFGLSSTTFELEVQNSGHALRLPVGVFAERLQSGHALRQISLRFAASLMHQVSMLAACGRIHSLQARYCRLLVMTHDRLESNAFALTQQAIAKMLGVRRMSINEVANRLNDEGLIEFRRGQIQILNVAILRRMACECYGRIRRRYKALLSADAIE